MACWSERGCDEEMRERCPHAIDAEEKCPAGCQYAQCERHSHEQTGDPALVFDPAIDRSAAVKEICLFCKHFLTYGPRV